jgi:hypothetical protein
MAMDQQNPRKQKARRLRNASLAATMLVTVPLARAEASTLAAFGWVNAFGSTGSGALEISLPGTVTSPQFNIAGASFSDITGFEYTFSSGLKVDIPDLTSHAFNPTPAAWTTTTITSTTVGGSGIGATDLTTGFIFGGANNLKIAESQGTLFNIQVANNLINPAGGGVANDFGYWKLESLTPVPLPGAMPLLLSALGMIGMARRRSKVLPATG